MLIEEYIRKLFIKEDEVLLNVKEKIKQHDHAIHISPEDAKLIQVLIKIAKPKKILEIGTHFGYSTIWIARALEDDAQIVTIERDKARYEMALNNFKEADLSDKIIAKFGDAEEILSSMQEKIDMVFIDANKSSYLKYLEWSIENLNKNGILIADNSLLRGSVYDENIVSNFSKKQINIMQEFNKIVAEKFFSILIPAKDGMTIGVKL